MFEVGIIAEYRGLLRRPILQFYVRLLWHIGLDFIENYFFDQLRFVQFFTDHHLVLLGRC